MAKLLFAGSFDPPTCGHIDIIRRASAEGEVTVGIFINPDKNYLFSVSERTEMLRRATADIPGVQVISDSGYTADFAKNGGYLALVRGYRNEEDLAGEKKMAEYNLARGGIETRFFKADPTLTDVSSSRIRDAIAKKDMTTLSACLHPTTLAYLSENNKI